MICPNCSAHYGCGCQAKIASDGTSVCISCIQSYELKRGIRGNPSPNNHQESISDTLSSSIAPKIKSIIFNNLNN